MDAKKKIRQIADEECVLDAAEIVIGEEYIDREVYMDFAREVREEEVSL